MKRLSRMSPEHDVVGVEQRPAVDRELHRVQRRLVTVEHDELVGVELRDLAAQLRADRATGAGDQHPLAGQVAGDRGDVGVDLVAAEQVGDVEVADVGDLDLARLDQLVRRWEHLHLDAGLSSGLVDLTDGLCRRARDGDHHHLGVETAHHLGELGATTDHRDAAHPAVAQGAVVVQQRHGRPPLLGVGQHGRDQLSPGGACAVHHRPTGVRRADVSPAGELTIGCRAVGDPHPRHEEQCEKRRARRNGPRHPAVGGEVDRP